MMKATGEVMSICNNFEGALMKAIRSLEQHVDSLMSYDFTGLNDCLLYTSPISTAIMAALPFSISIYAFAVIGAGILLVSGGGP